MFTYCISVSIRLDAYVKSYLVKTCKMSDAGFFKVCVFYLLNLIVVVNFVNRRIMKYCCNCCSKNRSFILVSL